MSKRMARGEATVPPGTRVEIRKQFRYQYAEPVREVVTRLRVLPTRRFGTQRVIRQALTVSPAPLRTRSFRDQFGNQVHEFHHDVVAECLEFDLQFSTRHQPMKPSALRGLQRLPAVPPLGARLELFRSATELVDCSPEMARVAAALAQVDASTGQSLARIGDWVYRTMRYRPGSTGVETRASVALAGGEGVCQDYTHIMLALLRAGGIPARYVSGFIPGEGYMHAWVEALLPVRAGSLPQWLGFDPTHNRPTDASYVAVAVGRDYADISPITGSFYGSAPGQLTSWAHARLHTPAPKRITTPRRAVRTFGQRGANDRFSDA